MTIMVSLPGSGSTGPDSSASAGDQPLGIALAAQPHLPEAARNAFWQANLFENWLPGMPIPAPPGPVMLSFMLGGLPSNAAVALAAGLDDPAHIERLVRFRPEGAIWAEAAKNPYLSRETVDRIAARNDGFDLVADRVSAQRLLDNYLAGIGSDPGVAPDDNDVAGVAERLIDAREGITIAGIIASNDAGTADAATTRLAEVLEEVLVNAVWGKHGTSAQLIRGVVVNQLTTSNPSWVAGFGAKVASNAATPIDAGALNAVEAALTGGLITISDVEAHMDSTAAVVAELRGGLIASLLDAPATPLVVRARRIGKRPEVRTGTRREADVLAMLGLGYVGARMSLASSAELTEEEIAESLETADVETILDWAENRLPHRPAPGQVGRQVDAMPYDRAKELAVEAQRRPDVLANNPELALALPGAAARFVPALAARAVRAHMERILGNENGAWMVAATLLSDVTNELNVLELAEASLLTGGIDATGIGV